MGLIKTAIIAGAGVAAANKISKNLGQKQVPPHACNCPFCPANGQSNMNNNGMRPSGSRAMYAPGTGSRDVGTAAVSGTQEAAEEKSPAYAPGAGQNASYYYPEPKW